MNRGEEILSMLAAGEGQTVEFKSSFNAEVIETLVAFANANGGNIDEVANMRFRTFNTSWDSYFTNQHSLEDVSLEKIKHFINEMNRHRDIPVTDEPLTVLRKFELVKDGMPSNACFLLFAGIDIFQSTISAGRFADPITIKDSVTIRSDLFSQIRLIMEFIIKQINKAIILTGALQHEERWQYPLNAVREGDEYSTPNTDKQTGGQTSGQTGSQTGGQTIFTGHLTAPQKEVLELIFQNNRITRKELAGKLGKSESAIQKNINLLKSKKLIKRIGGDFGGYWEVNK